MQSDELKLKRIVQSPPTVTLSSAEVVNVELADDEEVVWHWTHWPDGRSAVTGYDIIKQNEMEKD